MTSVSASTRPVFLFGHPIAHSVSPQLHNAAFAAAGVDAVYLACDVTPEAVGVAVGALGALGALGANVTVPHKHAALALADERTAEAEAVGAANTLWLAGATLWADNTDTGGLADVLARDVGLAPGAPVVLLGAGGAARAAAVALGRARATVDVVARRDGAAEQIRALAVAHGAQVGTADDARLVINATPLGLHGEPLPERFMQLRPGQIALDLVYGPADTPFLAAARVADARALDGRGLLVAQAARSFTRWTGLDAPLAVMRDACEAALNIP